MKPDSFDVEILRIAHRFKEMDGVGLPTLDRMLGIQYGDDIEFLIENELQAPRLRNRLERLIDSGLLIKIPPMNTYLLTEEGMKFI
jgi:hypothetical protein